MENAVDISIKNIVLKYDSLEEKEKYFVSGLVKGFALKSSEHKEEKEKGV